MPGALKLFETESNEHVNPDDTSTALANIEEVFGEVEVLDAKPNESVNPFALVFHTRFIVASPADVDSGSAQRVPPCGDQTPAYLGAINGPKGLLDDDEETPPLIM